MNLTQKEEMLLKDQKSHEKICIEKYTNYAEQAQDPELKKLFNDYAQQEQQHLDTINQILNGSVPQKNNQKKQQANQYKQNNQNQQHHQQNNQESRQNQTARAGMSNQKDARLCNDLLMTEKYVSGTYDTAIFESTDSNLRNALNHIQKEEQQHGEGIFNYMQQNGMYNPQ